MATLIILALLSCGISTADMIMEKTAEVNELEICIKSNSGYGEGSSATIYARILYDSPDHSDVKTLWRKLSDSGVFDNASGCKTFADIAIDSDTGHDYEGASWRWTRVELVSCSSDGLAIDKIKANAVSYDSFSMCSYCNDDTAEKNCLKSGYFWIDTAYYNWDCSRIGIGLEYPNAGKLFIGDRTDIPSDICTSGELDSATWTAVANHDHILDDVLNTNTELNEANYFYIFVGLTIVLIISLVVNICFCSECIFNKVDNSEPEMQPIKYESESDEEILKQ